MGTSKKRHNSGSHASSRVRIGGGSANIADRLKSKNRVFSKGQLTKIKATQAIIQTPPTAIDEGDDEDWITQGTVPYDERMEDILKGQEVFETSHEGEWAVLLDSYYKTTPGKRRRRDRRTRRDRTERRNRCFAPQIDGMTATFMAWDHERGKDGLSEGIPEEWEGAMGATTVLVVDFWRVYNAEVQANLEGNGLYWSTFLVHNGLFPCSPGVSKVTITTRTLETFRLLSLRCPRLGIQPFVKTLCDLHGVAFKPYLFRDLVMATLGRDSPNWCLFNTCPCCQYRLKDEELLKFSMLFTMDGNDSLKRVARRERGTDCEGNEGDGLGPSKEREDSRQGGGDYFLSREEVNQWARDSIQELFGQKDKDIFNESNGCADRWKNMTIVNRLLDVLGADLGGGYDIGCRFKATLSASPLREQVKSLNYTSLVGLFHGHAHCRLCQLQHLGTYIRGLGLEDLKGCERFFSQSNTLASSTRHASSFHRRQAISAYGHHHDNFKTYYNLSAFLVNNYKQALEILNSRGALLVPMQELGVKLFEEFPDWLKKEEAYLKGLKTQLQGEALEIEYFQKLEKLNRAE
ncbi:hypothetical protein PQX77_021063 [Marasmius sp. AFHP31]|nr:hypothetical protein PQX77_021063 [Marasmius sp. AFHP31]